MDLMKIESFLEGVGESHEEMEFKLGEVRERVIDAERVLGEARGALEEARSMIEYIREELEEEPYGDLYEEEELDLVRSRLLETELRHEELENEYDSLNTILGIESDSGEHELPDGDKGWAKGPAEGVGRQGLGRSPPKVQPQASDQRSKADSISLLIFAP